MKFVLSFFLLCFASVSHAQLLSGELLDEKRKMTSQQDFTIVSNYEGYVVYEVAVDQKGHVVSERFIPEQSTVKSTPANILAKNYLKDLTFEPGDYYPKHHHVLVKVKFTKEKAPGTKPKTAN